VCINCADYRTTPGKVSSNLCDESVLLRKWAGYETNDWQDKVAKRPARNRYTFADSEFFPRWKVKDVLGTPHGNYSAGNGYQDYTEPASLSYLKVGMVYAADPEVTSVAFTWNLSNNAANRRGVNVYLRDWTTGAIIGSWHFLEAANGNYTRSQPRRPLRPMAFLSKLTRHRSHKSPSCGQPRQRQLEHWRFAR
jgi:hypothetical protein